VLIKDAHQCSPSAEARARRCAAQSGLHAMLVMQKPSKPDEIGQFQNWLWSAMSES